MAASRAQNVVRRDSGQTPTAPAPRTGITHENIYGLNIPTAVIQNMTRPLSNSLAAFRRNLEANYEWPVPVPVESRRENEAQAVRRQRQLHRDWERVQRRNRERLAREVRSDAEQREDQASNQSTRRVRRRTSQPDSSADVSDAETDNISSGSSASSIKASPKMQPIDLTKIEDNQALTDLVAKEQQALIASQKQVLPTNSTMTPLAEYKCAICMDTPTDVTTTTCGHMFCHQCIIDSLRWSEIQLAETQRPPRNKGLCPVCRSHLDTKDVANSKNLVVLNIKKLSRAEYDKMKKAKAKGKGKGKARASTEDDLPTATTTSSSSRDRSHLADTLYHGSVQPDTTHAGQKRKRTTAPGQQEEKEEQDDESTWEKFVNLPRLEEQNYLATPDLFNSGTGNDYTTMLHD